LGEAMEIEDAPVDEQDIDKLYSFGTYDQEDDSEYSNVASDDFLKSTYFNSKLILICFVQKLHRCQILHEKEFYFQCMHKASQHIV
jgi:hypothetical protein